MRRLINFFAGFLLLFFCMSDRCAGDGKPVWEVDLHTVQLENPAEMTIKFAGPYLVVYTGSLVDVGLRMDWVRHPRLVFDSRSGQILSRESVRELILPPWDECSRTRFGKAYPAVNVIDCRKEMILEQIGGIGPAATEPAEFYLQEPGKDKVLVFRAQRRCQPGEPRFISDALILLQPCNNNVVVDKRGQKVYDMPRLAYYYLTLNCDGTRFVVYERDESFLHQFEGTDRLRVKVFRSSDGKKLFDYRWHPADEMTNDGRVALSDDGSLVAIIRGEKVLVFSLPQ